MPSSLCRIPRQLIYGNVYVLKGMRSMMGAFGGPVLRVPRTVGPFIVDTGRRGSLSTDSNPPTPQQQSSAKQGDILLSSDVETQGAGGGGCGFPGTITFWKEQQRGGLCGGQPRRRDSLRLRKEEELLHYNRTGAGLSCRLWHHWQRQQQHQHEPKEQESCLDLVQPEDGKGSTVLHLVPVEPQHVPKEQETHVDMVHPEDGKGSTVLHLVPMEDQHPLESCFRKASPDEAAEDLDARGEPRYKYEGWGIGRDGGRQQQLRIIAASLRIVYQEDDEDLGGSQGARRGSGRLWGEEALLLRRGVGEESAAPLCALSAESISWEFAHLAPLVRSTLECVSVVPPHSLPLLPPPQSCESQPFMIFDDLKGNANRLVSAFLLSAVGFFLLLITTFYIAYFL